MSNSTVRKLASHTLVYGVSTILGRVLNFALIPLFTWLLGNTADLGIINSLFGYIALLNVLCAMGMETTFFYYANKSDTKEAFGNAFIVILIPTLIIACGVFFGAEQLDQYQQTGNANYYRLIAGMLLFDALAILPFALLRQEEKSRKFAGIKFLSICLNVGFNLLFLYACSAWSQSDLIGSFVDSNYRVFYIFLAGCLASFITLLLVVKTYFIIEININKSAIKKMLSYSWPLIIVGLAAWVNENMDKSIMERIYPGGLIEGRSAAGIYGSVYKLSIAMALVVQAFKFAAEPFFFSIQKNNDAKKTYADVLTWFVIVECLVFLVVSLYLDYFLLILEPQFRSGKMVVPVVLMGQLFLGIYYNLSIWYKLTEKTIWGLIMSLCGAIVTITLLFTLVPKIGYMGAAWATLASFLVMMLLSLVLGRKHYSVPYNYRKIFMYISLSIGLYVVFHYVLEAKALSILSATVFLFIFIAIVWIVEKPKKLLLLRE